MKPVYLVGEMGRGGQERQLRYLLLEWRKLNQPCGLIIWVTNKEYDADLKELLEAGVDVLSLESIGLINKFRLGRKFIKSNGGTLLHSYTFYLNFYTSILGWLCGIPAIGGIRNRLLITLELSGQMRFILSSLFPRKKIANNRLYQRDLRFPFSNWMYKNTQIVTNQLDMKNRPLVPVNPKNPIQSCSVARLYAEKDIPMLIEALRRAKLAGFKFKHRHAGKGPLLDTLLSQVALAGLDEDVEFVGELENTKEFVQSADIFLHSARSEGYPNVIMEALANGRPVLTTQCGDAEDLVQNGVNGYCVPVGDIGTYTEQLKLLLQNPEGLRKMGSESYRIAMENFNLTKLAHDTRQAYFNFEIE